MPLFIPHPCMKIWVSIWWPVTTYFTSFCLHLTALFGLTTYETQLSINDSLSVFLAVAKYVTLCSTFLQVLSPFFDHTTPLYVNVLHWFNNWQDMNTHSYSATLIIIVWCCINSYYIFLLIFYKSIHRSDAWCCVSETHQVGYTTINDVTMNTDYLVYPTLTSSRCIIWLWNNMFASHSILELLIQ